MYCLGCGAEVREGSKFCSSCGSAVPTGETLAGGKRSIASRGSVRRRVILGATIVAVGVLVVLGVLLMHPFGGDGEATAPGANMYRGNPAHTGEYPGPGPEGSPTLLWRFETGESIGSSAAIVDGVVYVGSDDDYVYAIDAVTGREDWRFETGMYVHSSPAVVDGVVYVGSGDDYVYAIDAATGREGWRFWTGGQSSPAVAHGVVYVSGDHHVYALDAATGAERWRFQTGDYDPFSPAVADGVVYVGSLDRCVHALDATTGAERWRFQTGDFVVSSPAVADGVVYVGSYDSYVYALDAATGAERWRFQTADVVHSSPAVADGVVYVGSYDSYVYALDATTGVERWRFLTGGPVQSPPAIVGGGLYVGSQDGYVYSLDAAVGEEGWRFGVGSSVASGPVVVDGVVYIGGSDGYVYAIGSQPGGSGGRPASSTPSSSRPEDVVRLFYERLVKFDTAGMVKLACPDARSDVETGIGLLQSFIGLGQVTGAADVELSLEDFEARTVSQEQDRAVVVVTGRLNAGAPLGSMDLDGTEAVLRLENGQWCLAGEESDGQARTETPVEGEGRQVKSYAAEPAMTIDTTKKYTAVINVEREGEIRLELFADKAPHAVNSFVFLARDGFYDGLTFFRVVPGFVAQAGDPTCSTDPTVTCTGSGGPGYFLMREDSGHSHDVGVLALAAPQGGNVVSGSQFYIAYTAQNHLDGRDTVFGRAVEGQDVLDSLTATDSTNPTAQPGDKIVSITIEETW